MPRTRELKPAFFQDEDLATVSRDHRLLFQALWTLADREGRLEDRPAFIKLYSFPFDADVQPCDIDRMLTDLAAHAARFIHRYSVNGKRYLVVRNLKKHQHIHPKEAASEIPGPEKSEPAMELPGTTESAVKESEVSPLPSIPSLPSSTLPPARVRDPSGTGTGPVYVPPANEPGKPTPYFVVSRFLLIRRDVLGGGEKPLPGPPFAQPSQGDTEKAAAWLSSMTAEDAEDIEPAIRLACKHVAAGDAGWTNPAMTKISFLFGCIVTSWTDLREELHGCAPKLPEKAKKQDDDKPKPRITPVIAW